MRFLVDECTAVEITSLFQSKNFDVYDPRFKKSRGMDDAAILKLARGEKRIIITRDLDFNLIAIKKFRPKGIILLRFRTEIKVTTIIKFFKNFMNSDDLAKCENHIVVISSAGIRIRKLSLL